MQKSGRILQFLVLRQIVENERAKLQILLQAGKYECLLAEKARFSYAVVSYTGFHFVLPAFSFGPR